MFIYVKKAVGYIKTHGVKKFYLRATRMLRERRMMSKFHEKLVPTEAELQKQRNTDFEKEPLVSIVVPLYNTPEKFLRELTDSVIAQTYSNWEICFADGSTDGTDLKSILESYSLFGTKIKYKKIENKSISDNTNEAIAMAKGDYIAFSDHDDFLEKNALFEVVSEINNYPSADFIYSDEDKVSEDGKKYFAPHFKSDFNLEMLRSVNYICHLVVVSKELIDKVGCLRNEYDGAQDYDFVLRATEQAKCIRHIPKLLYHWRSFAGSTSLNSASKSYAYTAGERALNDQFKRMGIKASAKTLDFPGFYRTKYVIDSEPLVSIIIPNKDHVGELDCCIKSLYDSNSYKNFEIIIVENNSTEKETFDYYEKLQKLYKEIKVVKWDKGFNFSAINNYGAKFAKGEYLLLLNNDVYFRNDCKAALVEMMSVATRKEVGIVGSKLYYPDGAIQHAGITVGIRGTAGNSFAGASHEDMGYFNRAIIMQELSAVTAACLLVRKSVFDEVAGLDETLVVAFNDVDFCLKVRQAGYLVIFDPYAELTHAESKSRGSENSPEKIKRFTGEMKLFKDKWKDFLEKGDPYYNKNLTLEMCDYSLNVDDK